jgi:hypothetical protein
VDTLDLIGGRAAPLPLQGAIPRRSFAPAVVGLVFAAGLSFRPTSAQAQATTSTTPGPNTTGSINSTTTPVARSAQIVPSTLPAVTPTGPTVSVAPVAPPTSAPASTIPPAVSLVVTHEIASGFSNTNQPLGPQRTTITVANQGPAILFNQQMVVKFGAKPDTIYFVKESGASVGVIDGSTGVWFHTIAQLTPNSPVVYTVTWNKSCPGRWPLGARVGDAVSWPVFQWISPGVGVGCPPDETVKPESQALPWPASFPTPPVIAPVLVTSTTTVPPPGSGTTASSTTTTKPAGTAPAVVPSVTVTSSVSSRPSTSVLYCRTVNKKRVCGPSRATAKTTKPKGSSKPKSKISNS